MENKKEIRPAAYHPAIQNLRCFLKDYLQSNPHHTLKSFALSLNRSSNELGRYLRGEVSPRRKMIESWATAFGVDYDYMQKAEFEYIDYPFDNESAPKKSGRHITKREVRQHYDEMIDEVNAYVSESEDAEYGKGILDILYKHRI